MNKPNPKKQERRLANIKQAAYDLFIKQGYEKTTFKQIVSLSGGSYSSIYSIYKNKLELFRAIFDEKIKDTLLNFQDDIKEHFELPLKEFLSIFSEKFLNIIQSDHYILAFNLIVSTSYQNPNIQQWLGSKSEYGVFNILSDYLRQCKELDDATKQNSYFLAKTYCCGLQNYLVFDRLILGAPILKSEEQKNFIEKSIELFLFGIKKT